MTTDEYVQAQVAVANLKGAVLSLLKGASRGLTNAVIGRSLGIYGGHKGHEGHISRTILAMLEVEGLVEQDPNDQTWSTRGDKASSGFQRAETG